MAFPSASDSTTGAVSVSEHFLAKYCQHGSELNDQTISTADGYMAQDKQEEKLVMIGEKGHNQETSRHFGTSPFKS